MILAATASAVGFAYDAGTGDKTLSAVFSVCYALGCILAVLAVRQSGVFSAVIQPPLILFFAVPTAFFVFHGSKITGIKDTLINCGYPLIERFPLMFFTSAIVLLVGMGRWYFGMAARRAKAHDADIPDAAVAAVADTGLAAAAVAAKEKPPERRGRRHSIERPSAVVDDVAPPRPARRPRTTTGTERASRSRHARPPETELIEPVPPRPRRPRPAGAPADPEPRRRTRASQPREREPREPRDPRPRRTPPPADPRERSERYDRPQRGERPDPYERPARRRPSDYDPYERPANGVPRSPKPSDSGSHHPVSRVRYRASDDGGDSRTENRTRPPRPRNPETDSWQYDV